jgi:hypothetical protein
VSDQTSDYTPQLVTGGRRYAVVDGEGLVVNVILWDGETPYDPGDGLELVRLEDGDRTEPGDQLP